MKRLMLLLLMIGRFLWVLSDLIAGATDAGQTVDPAHIAEILDSTVVIKLLSPRLDRDGAQVFVREGDTWHRELTLENGLGTAVLLGEQTVIVTHDHWSTLSPGLLKVSISSHDGRPLATISGSDFQRLIRYRDGGTLAFSAPVKIRARTSAAAGPAIAISDKLLLALFDPQNGRVEVIPVSVVAVETGSAPRTIRLHARRGVKINSGSSGGGVWSQNRLVGNLWSIVQDVEPGKPDFPSYADAAESYAAVIPAVARSELSPTAAWDLACSKLSFWPSPGQAIRPDGLDLADASTNPC